MRDLLSSPQDRSRRRRPERSFGAQIQNPHEGPAREAAAFHLTRHLGAREPPMRRVNDGTRKARGTPSDNPDRAQPRLASCGVMVFFVAQTQRSMLAHERVSSRTRRFPARSGPVRLDAPFGREGQRRDPGAPNPRSRNVRRVPRRRSRARRGISHCSRATLRRAAVLCRIARPRSASARQGSHSLGRIWSRYSTCSGSNSAGPWPPSSARSSKGRSSPESMSWLGPGNGL